MIERLKRWLGISVARPDSDYTLIANSDWFDPQWYRANALGHWDDSTDPVRHYLCEGARAGLSPGPRFDAGWYLSAYPDVANANLNPLVHFLKHGRQEGRLPRRNRALARDFHLWRGAGPVMVERLQRLIDAEDASQEERHHARWSLARWCAWQDEPRRAVDYLIRGGELIAWPRTPAPALLALESLQRSGAGLTQARIPLALLDDRWPESANTLMAHANVAAWGAAALEERVAFINAPWRKKELTTIGIEAGSSPLLDRIAPAPGGKRLAMQPDAPLVSVIVPVYNAAGTVSTAIRSLFDQTWRRLEIIVVDDASTDETRAELARLEAGCPVDLSFRIVAQGENGGAYAARNAGLAVARGDLITTHDSDDWSHPDKLALQAAALERSAAPACISFWSRATPELLFHRWRLEDEGWVHRNLSSLMFRREVVERLGFWDEVRVNADSEYLARIEAAYGAASIEEVEPGLPLAFGRSSELSLSQHGDTHACTQFQGTRAMYMSAARRWHERAKAVDDFYLMPGGGSRPFPAPREFLRGEPDVASDDERDLIEASGYFDPGWYLRRYPQLQDTRIEALEHYWREGRFTGYDPGPDFSQSGYARQTGETVAPEDALAHFLRHGDTEGFDPLPIFEGRQPDRPEATTVMLCGHQAGAQLYGAERSLIDVARGLDELGFRVVVVLPTAVNASYIETLRQHCTALAIRPFGWWQKGREPEPATVNHIERLIERQAIDLVAANSLVLDEPLVAAKQLGLPVVVHLRELPRQDAALCDTLNADAQWIVEAVCARADLLIANSRFTASQFVTDGGEGVRLATVPNTIEMQSLLELSFPEMAEIEELVVGILSSSHANKGLTDLEPLLASLEARELGVRIIVFGPVTPALEALSQRHAENASARIELAGYVDSPAAALSRVQLVLSLAHFQESFGRTALEAMAAGRPFIGYHRGALPEVVGEEAGILVPFGDVRAITETLAGLKASPSRIAAMGQSGRQRAVSQFGWNAFMASLEEAYSGVSRRSGA
ncbi:glycosyltransferase [Salinicola salarius]|uniref:glycosyltransferase n=1 Tax=Salinicola salarius TaxID=430457 RepID=UPI0023E37C6A|nr:glycosyltransferase [Salinicola salarius]MDF3917775.1 glycosyltransferase [Salinicola salarius]